MTNNLIIMRSHVLAWLANNVSEERLQHILGVEKMCIELAHYHQVDEKKAACAGLMHDLAKFFSPKKLLQMAQEEGMIIDEICAKNPHLLHANVSALIARDEFSIKDEEILAAIANHTLGTPEMSDLSCIVFVADALELGRGNTPELEKMRQMSKKNLYKSVGIVSDYSLRYLIDKTLIIHPRTVLTRNWAWQNVFKKETATKAATRT